MGEALSCEILYNHKDEAKFILARSKDGEALSTKILHRKLLMKDGFPKTSETFSTDSPTL